MQILQLQTESVRKAQAILAITAVLLAAGFVMMVYRPQTRRMAELEASIHNERQSLNVNQSRAMNLPAVAREVETLRQKLERFDKRLPRQEELGHFISDVTSIQQKVNLRKMTWGRGEPRHTELFAELPLSLKFEGDFFSVFSFLRQAEEMPRLTRVRSLSVKSKDDKPGQVDVQVSMNIYFAE